MTNSILELETLLTPELTLALLCSQKVVREDDQQEIVKLVQSGLNWPLFMELVIKHRLFPLVYWRFMSLSLPGIPIMILTKLQHLNKVYKIRVLQMTEEMMKIVQILEEYRIRVIIIKGIPLAQLLYQDITHRISNDIDLLIHPADMEKARGIIETMGYTFEPPVYTQEKMPEWMEQTQSFCYFNEKKQIELDLTWRLGSHGATIPWEEIEKCVEKFNFVGRSIWIIKREVLFLHLILHGAGHAWFRLKWLLDIDRMVQQADFSWDVLYKVANQLQLTPIVNQTLMLAQGICDTALPPAIVKQLNYDKLGKKLARQVVPLLEIMDFNPTIIEVIPPSTMFYLYKKYRVCMLNSWQKKLQYIYFELMNIIVILSRRIGRRVKKWLDNSTNYKNEEV